MTSVVNKYSAAANRLIKRTGQLCVLSKTTVTNKVYNPVTDEYDGVVSTTNVPTTYSYQELDLTKLNLNSGDVIKEVVVVPYNQSYVGIDTTWKFNVGTTKDIKRIEPNIINDIPISYVLYLG